MGLDEIRRARMSEPGAREGYARAKRAFELGWRVRECREAAGITQAQLAMRAGTSQAAIARLEAGGAEPRISTLERIAAALDARLVIDLAPAS